MSDFFECVFLFGSHLRFGFGGFVSLTCEVKQTVDNDAMKLVQEGCIYLFCVGSDCIKRYIYVTIYARARAIIEGNNVGIVVVLEKLLIDGKDLLIVAEDVVEFAYGVAVLGSGTLDPLFDFSAVNGRHFDIISVEGNHGK